MTTITKPRARRAAASPLYIVATRDKAGAEPIFHGYATFDQAHAIFLTATQDPNNSIVRLRHPAGYVMAFFNRNERKKP